jgi:hypothetical protein
MMGMNGTNNLAVSGLKRSRRNKCVCAKLIRFYSEACIQSMLDNSADKFRCFSKSGVTYWSSVGVGPPPDDVNLSVASRP